VGEGADAGPWVRIRAAGPAGAAWPAGSVLPAGLDGASAAPDGGLLVTVPADRSDAVLRALLTATPPWRIRGVEELP
ncbi:ABC transporter ATP-binding protein, partial [Streptomyces sp. BR123]|nr:ABC transporter ATP-binding protein [Streptomyces sp. BR123]